jgi:hypothetical protein
MHCTAIQTLGTTINTTSVRISGRRFAIYGDDDYLRGMGEEFEPDTVALFALLCGKDSRVLDVGANIGMTALALAQICPAARSLP